MKRVIISLALVMISLLIVGCVNYKETPLPFNEGILNDIANIEQNISIEEEIVEEIEIETKEDISEMPIIHVKENQNIKLLPEIFDPNEDDVTYEFSKPLSPEGKWDINYGDAGEYIITLTATDGELVTEQIIKLVVERVNVAPVITPQEDIFIKEGDYIEFEPEVYDPNNDPIEVTVSGPLAEGKFFADYESSGEYNIVITATDGELTAEETFMLYIENVNRAPIIEGLEEIIYVKEGETLVLDLNITDPDGDKIEVTISDPVGNDGVWEIGYTDSGTYMVTVIADDGQNKTIKSAKIVVQEVNMPPEIVDIILVVN